MPDGRTIVVTGASSGIGRALAVLAAREGFGVAAVARRVERLEEVVKAILAAGGKAVALAGDVTARDMPARIVATAMQSFGRLDVVVNNAGRGAYGDLLEQSDEAIESQWQLNVAAPLRIARAALPQLEITRGQLVFLGSGIARVPLPRYGAYAVAKAGIRAAAGQLRRELKSHGVAVTYVDPGLVATEFHIAMGVERAKEVPASSPERVARAILRGITRRSAVVNAVPWQTAGAIAGEWAATLADPYVISRLTPTATSKAPVATSRFDSAQRDNELAQPSAVMLSEVEARSASRFDAALEPVARRMERVKLSQQFLRDALLPGTKLELNELAMRWAGMPNKNERAALHEALDALAAAGYLQPAGNETWTVVRAAD